MYIYEIEKKRVNEIWKILFYIFLIYFIVNNE